MTFKRALVWGFCIVASVHSVSQANVGDAFGFGSRVMALGGAGGALTGNTLSIYHNPAALAAQKGPRLQFNYGFMYVQPSFKGISGVTVQNSFVADAVSTGNVDTNYKATVGQDFSFTFRLMPETMNFTIGMLAFLPFNQAAYMDTGETYVPEYFLYRARTQRPQIEFGAGAELGEGLYFGAGIHTAFSLSGSATAFLNTAANTASSLRFASTLTPRLAPYFGFFFDPVESDFSFSTVVRLAASSSAEMKMKSSAGILSPVPAADFNLTASSALFYDPMALELGGSVQVSDSLTVVAQVDYQIWNQFRAPAMNVEQTPDDLTGSLTIARGIVPSFDYVNIIVPRLGAEWSVTDQTSLRLGYFYRPSIIRTVATGPGNYLDPAKHAINAGVGYLIPDFSGSKHPLRVDFTLTYHALVPFSVVKTAGNEAGVTTESKIGAPGYDVGGSLFGGAVSVALAI